VALAALIIAQDGEAGQPEQAALLPLLGQTVIEFQARQAHAVGATHLIICAAQFPAALVSAVDRLRAEGINASFARNAHEAAESIHPDEDLLLFAEGAIASTERLQDLAVIEKAAIIVRAHNPQTAHLELIDADHVWAGIARIDGALIRKTSAILGEWSLAPTLLRMAIQAGASRIELKEGGRQDITVIRDRPGARDAGDQLLSLEKPRQIDALSQFGVDPIAKLAAKIAGHSALPFAIIALIPLALMLVAIGLAAFWWIKTALAVFVVAAIPAVAATKLGSASLRRAKALDWHFRAKSWVGRGLIFAATYWLVLLGSDWGCLVLAAWIVWQLAISSKSGLWGASEEGCILILLIGLMSGFPVAGLILALLSALIAPMALRLGLKTAD
jgi:hypothetical protein